jgi:hypothetical protein
VVKTKMSKFLSPNTRRHHENLCIFQRQYLNK